jgi:hypothetical protein
VYEIDYQSSNNGFKLVYTTEGATGEIGAMHYMGPISVSQYTQNIDWFVIGCSDTHAAWRYSDKLCFFTFDTASKTLIKYYGTLE